ncbi:hypothetical protein, partial [Bradyrhizobium uaiense]
TVVNGGILQVDGSIVSSSSVTVNSGGVLSGGGIVGNTTIASGAVPVTLADVDAVEFSPTRYSAPDWKVRFPTTFRNVPGVVLPG